MSQIEATWENGKVLRLNTVADLNKIYADKLGAIETPTFILFDAQGKELNRWVGEIPLLDELP